jgi:hypothetical protein
MYHHRASRNCLGNHSMSEQRPAKWQHHGIGSVARQTGMGKLVSHTGHGKGQPIKGQIDSFDPSFAQQACLLDGIGLCNEPIAQEIMEVQIHRERLGLGVADEQRIRMSAEPLDQFVDGAGLEIQRTTPCEELFPIWRSAFDAVVRDEEGKEVAEVLLAEYGRRYELEEARLDPDTLELARGYAYEHRAPAEALDATVHGEHRESSRSLHYAVDTSSDAGQRNCRPRRETTGCDRISIDTLCGLVSWPLVQAGKPFV